jgi:hypothetical protein
MVRVVQNGLDVAKTEAEPSSPANEANATDVRVRVVPVLIVGIPSRAQQPPLGVVANNVRWHLRQSREFSYLHFTVLGLALGLDKVRAVRYIQVKERRVTEKSAFPVTELKPVPMNGGTHIRLIQPRPSLAIPAFPARLWVTRRDQ